MKKFAITIFTFLSFSFTGIKAQSEEAQQLLLNVEKLAQLKKILKNMYKGYEVVSKGYNTIQDISKGNFNMHQVFLDELMKVSPVVKRYKRVADIIQSQSQILTEYKTAQRRFKGSNLFNTSEWNYIIEVNKNLFNISLKNLNELALVITARQLRMTDDERILAIDRIYKDISDQLIFLRSFNSENAALALQRKLEQQEIKVSEKLNGL